jgi:hypothetical protein
VKALLFVIALAVLAAGCPGDDSCGPGDAPGDGLTVTGNGVDLRYHALSATPNNDCPDPAAPEGVVSLTIVGTQVNGADAFNLCVPRPDQLESDLPLVPNTQTHAPMTIEIVDVNAAAGGCTFVFDDATPPTGTAHAEGICADGTDPAGFALLITGQVSLERTCGAQVDVLRVDLAGTVSVASQ